MKRKYRFFLSAALIAWLSFATGCLFNAKLPNPVASGGADSHYIKKVGILSAGLNHGTWDSFDYENELITAFVGRCTDVGTEIITAAPGTDSTDLVLAARKKGFSAILIPGDFNVSNDKKKSGLLWFASKRKLFEIRMGVLIMDTLTGAKIFDKTFCSVVKGEELEEETDAIATTSEEKELIKEEIEELLKEVVKASCQATEELQWHGIVLDKKRSTIVINAGKDQGIKIGDTFTVYGLQNQIKGVMDQTFWIPGEVTGRVEVKKVGKNRATAVIKMDKGIASGDFVLPG